MHMHILITLAYAKTMTHIGMTKIKTAHTIMNAWLNNIRFGLLTTNWRENAMVATAKEKLQI
jgi:hypothetical protein